MLRLIEICLFSRNDKEKLSSCTNSFYLNNIFKFSISRKLLFKYIYFYYIFLSRIAVNSIEHLQNIYRFVRSQNLKIQVTITIPFLIQYTFLRVSTSLSESKSTGVSRFDKDFRKNIEKALNISLQTSALHKQYKHLDL